MKQPAPGSLQSDSTVSHYRIVTKIGAGGMGEVWKATDTRLGREVAIKFLPASFADDSDRLERFEQEARATSTLNHPNILTVYDVGTHDGAPYIVEELLEGEDFRDLLASGPIALRLALDYAHQIAAGLAAAHERGIIHRDLKPENLFATKDGRVKILDFGLAKLKPQRLPEPIDSEAETRRPATNPGAVMGTVGYMSPEQARGAEADHRSDIFSLGAVLYEMLTGSRAFHGDSFAETLSAVLKDEPPDIREINERVPPPLERIVSRCLEKRPERRFQSASDLAFAVEALSTPSGSRFGSGATVHTADPDAPYPLTRWQTKRGWAFAIAAGFFLLASLVLLPFAIADLRQPRSGSLPIVRYQISTPPKAALNLIRWPSLTISPDGSTVAFVATSEGVNRLYVRRRDDPTEKVLAGTEDASQPAFSPDGKWIAFFADFALKKVSLDGPVTPLAKAGNARGVCWASNDSLIYSMGASEPLLEVSADGGEPRQVTRLDEARNERSHRWPQALPGGKAVIFTVGTVDSQDSYERSNIEAVILATGERRVVFQGASMARYIANGNLVFARGGSLFAVPFDPDTLTVRGTPNPVVQGVAGDETTGAVHFAVADDGTLAYIPGTSEANTRRLVWADRSGNLQPIDLQPGPYNDVRISPDGSRLALLVGGIENGDIWIYDFSRASMTRLTFNAHNASPLWSADGKNVYYSAIDPTGKTIVRRKPADGSRDAEAVTSLPHSSYLKAITPDGNLAIFDYWNGTSDQNIVESAMTMDAQPTPLLGTPFTEWCAALSPDGRWLAYQSDESGSTEVYVRELSGGGGRWQISTGGGEEPHWSRDGRELFFRNKEVLMSADVTTTPAFQAAKPKTLFNGVYDLRSANGVTYDVDPNGGRFIMIRPAEENREPAEIQVVVNWFDELHRLMPNR